MRIGIDITPLQGPHRMRGIGYTLINFINHLPEEAKKEHDFVFFTYDTETYGNPLELLNLDGIMYESRVIEPLRVFKAPDSFHRWLKYCFSLVNQLNVLKDIYLGDSRIKELGDLDRFMQFDQNQPLPTRKKVESTMIIYDLIPYVMESDYLWSYHTARLNDSTRKGALRQEYRRRRWAAKVRLIVKRAKNLIAISEHTKQDFIKHLGIQPRKIHVVPLGADAATKDSGKKPLFEKFISTSWGPIPRKVNLKGRKFLLFIGGADPRRKLDELVAAFNNLRARGNDIKLVFAGDTMQGPFEIPNLALQRYFKHTSYLDDIYFLGFVNDAQRDWLYRNALAFIYPSVYEGFGLPILEAMQYGTPVITYDNSSIKEVAGEAAIYVEDFQDIVRETKALIKNYDKRIYYATSGKKQAAKFAWQKTVKSFIDVLVA